jgi:serine/threonine-protein kinase
MIGPGSTVDQKYWVERVVGRGGMGVVVAATHLQLGQRVALKFLHGDASYDPEAVARFLREARSAVRLRSEHVGRVLDVGTLDDGAPYIVMEYLEGEDLGALLARGGPLPVATAADLVLQACLALAEAHAARIVHRDLKPSNLFLTRRPDGTPLLKVMDFGIAKAHGTLHAEITASSAVIGSPPYMSPEQLRSARSVDARSDIWSLGVVLYELVSGRRPYVADSVTAMAVRIATEEPAPLPPAVPRAYADVVMRCLARERERRFADVAALARALAPSGSAGATDVAASVARVAAGGGGAPRRPAAVRALMEASTVSRASSTTTGGDTVRYLARRKAFWIGIVAGVLAVAIVTVTVIALGRERARAVRDDRDVVDAIAVDAAAPAVAIDAGAGVMATGASATDASLATAVTAAAGDAGAGERATARGGARGGHGGHAAAAPRTAVAIDAGPPTVAPPVIDARPAIDAGLRGRGPDACVPTTDDENCDGIPDRR